MGNKIVSVITGASGFVGSHLADYLIARDHHVRCILRKSSSKRWLENKPVEIFDCGLFDKNSLKSILKDADYLFHIAGVVKSKNEEGYFKGNVETTRNLLEVVSEVNPNIKRVIIASSLTACGPSLDGKPVTEETPEHPITTYGRSKLAQEQLAKSFMNKLPITIARLHAVYGERDTEIYKVFQLYNRGLMTLVGFDEKRLNALHVFDAVEGIYLASLSEAAKGEIYFLASEEIYTWHQIGEALAKAFGKKALTIKVPHFMVYTIAAIAQFFSFFNSQPATFNLEKAKDFVQKNWICDVSKAKKDFGFRQSISLEEGMKRTVGWYKEMKWL
ncbi:NAD-dependent epimerase/dehydratase family protein [Melioribacteraceae bacterium 4301-Me]|uniref:NAD-dependent epimerase/dehydratase family protein n=1 Tax=Pyranulibacter aquaticus TaxID=3163344 RepID=UPI00359BA2CB